MNRKQLFRASAAALLTAASLSVAAALPDGVRTGKDGTVVTISAEATLSQANDEATVNLYYTETLNFPEKLHSSAMRPAGRS